MTIHQKSGKQESQGTGSPPVLETSRLILRPLQEKDANDLFHYAKNPNVSHHTLWEPHQTIEDSKEFIHNSVLKKYSQKIPDPLAITLKRKTERAIGTVGCFWVSQQNKTMELADALDEAYWGQGLTVKASKRILDYVFQEYEVFRIQGQCKSENLQSYRVLEKLGMKHEGTLRSGVFHRDRFWDMHCHSILKNEWIPLRKN